MNQTKIKLLTAFMLVFLLITIYAAWSVTLSKEEKKKSSYTRKHTSWDAFEKAKPFVLEKLQYTSTPEFPLAAEQDIYQHSDSVYVVTSYVDAEDRNGAYKRNYFTCVMVFYNNGRTDCLNLKIQDKSF